jgi:ABC-type branched-subunit amino acid transport system permease subunit
MSAFWYYVFTLVFFLFDYFILAMGLNIQYGETGILNFAYIGFVAIGAYVTGATSMPRVSTTFSDSLCLSPSICSSVASRRCCSRSSWR